MRDIETNIDLNTSLEEGPLSRWKKRKQKVRLDTQSLQEQQPSNLESEVDSDKQLLTDVDMPDIDTLTEDSDYKGFMSPNVSESLRKIALQKLFHGSSMNFCDGLDVYDGDYTSFAKLGNVITADIAHHLERAAEKNLDEKSEEGGAGPKEKITEQSEQEQNQADGEGYKSSQNQSVASEIISPQELKNNYKSKGEFKDVEV